MIPTEQKRLDLYHNGLNDGQIASQLGLERSTIRQWRKSRGLAANVECVRTTVTGGRCSVRRLLHEMGWGAKSIARAEGVNLQTVREWRKRHAIKSSGMGKKTSRRGRAEQLHDLERRVIRAVGTSLPFDIAADAAAALMLAVMEGQISIDQIESQGRAFGNRALREYADAFKQQSLDQEIPGTEGLRGIDMLVDESSSAWLEEMGGTCH
ncbi:hypothetical protein [Sphingobium yanoikuyae]